MATATTLTARIEGILDVLEMDVQDLEAWETLPETNQDLLGLEWSQSMTSLLPEVNSAYRSGRMTPEQQARYRTLLGRLKEALPIIQKLNLCRPRVPLDD